MVCDSCEKKLTVAANPGPSSKTGGKIKAGKTNKLLQKAKDTWIPKDTQCRICKSKTQLNYNFCNNCAHQKGICTMCGKKTIDVSKLKMSLT